MGIMGYQNSSWDICDLSKKVSGPRHYNFKIPFMGPIFGPETYILFSCDSSSICSNRCHVLVVDVDVVVAILLYIVK